MNVAQRQSAQCLGDSGSSPDIHISAAAIIYYLDIIYYSVIIIIANKVKYLFFVCVWILIVYNCDYCVNIFVFVCWFDFLILYLLLLCNDLGFKEW